MNPRRDIVIVVYRLCPVVCPVVCPIEGSRCVSCRFLSLQRLLKQPHLLFARPSPRRVANIFPNQAQRLQNRRPILQV
jgi:hypothetical protein